MARSRKGSAASMRFARDEEEVLEREDRQQFVVLLRHGIAEEHTEEKPDFHRSLTKDGIQRMKKISRGLASIFPEADVIISSPLVRCVQTALWMAKAYDQKIEIRTAEELAPGATPYSYLALLKRVEVGRVIVVGHEPDLSDCMRTLVGLKSGSNLQLEKGGAYGLNISTGDAALRWMLTPRILRKLG